MTRIDTGWRADLPTGWAATTWQDGWLLVAAVVRSRRNSDGKLGVVALHPDGRVQRVGLKAMEHFGRHVELCAFRVVLQPEPESSAPRVLRRGRERDLGAAFSFRHNGPKCYVATDPLRILASPPHPDALLRYHTATQDAGDVTVETFRHYKGNRANKWCTNGQREKLLAAFEVAGDTGFVIYSRQTGCTRVIDLGEPVERVEIRPDGLVAAAILKNKCVVFVDLGDD